MKLTPLTKEQKESIITMWINHKNNTLQNISDTTGVSYFRVSRVIDEYIRNGFI